MGFHFSMKHKLPKFVIFFALSLILPAFGSAESGVSNEKVPQLSDHFNGTQYFNPGDPEFTNQAPGQEKKRIGSRWFWHWLLGNDWPEWPALKNVNPGPPPEKRLKKGVIRVTPIGHSTFLIQMDGVNILTDPIWSERCSPVSWAGPKRHMAPGIRFEDMPPIDVILLSHNHYDHLDLPTLSRFADKGTGRAIVPMGNPGLVRKSGIPVVDELEWWQSVQLSPEVTITLVPARHFSLRTLWDRNKALWAGFVISGPSGSIYYAGDTGYGPHFREIKRRFGPIKIAILPISPFRPQQAEQLLQVNRYTVHMGPEEAVRAHLDLNAQLSIAAHFQVFQLGFDGFDDAVNGLKSALHERNLKSDVFIAPTPGEAIDVSGF